MIVVGIRFFDTVGRVAMATDSASVSELGACFLVFPQLGEADSAVMQTLLAQVTEEVTEESSALLLPSSSSVAILA